MKKFTLFAGLAVLATVGSAFAAWTFDGDAGTTTANADNVGVIIDNSVVTTNMGGTLTITHKSGDEKVVMKQTAHGKYSFILEDQTDENKDTYTVKYVPGYGEETDKYNYSLEFNTRIAYNGQIISGYSGGQITTVSFVDGVYENTFNLSGNLVDLWKEDSINGPITFNRLNSSLTYIDTPQELKAWLDDFKKAENPNTLNLVVTAKVTRSLK